MVVRVEPGEVRVTEAEEMQGLTWGFMRVWLWGCTGWLWGFMRGSMGTMEPAGAINTDNRICMLSKYVYKSLHYNYAVGRWKGGSL